MIVGVCCGLVAMSGSLGVGHARSEGEGELLQLAFAGQPGAVQALALPAEQVPSAERRREDLPLPYEAEPEDPASVSDALEIAQRRIEEAYAELEERQARLLREKEELEMDRSGDVYERRLHLERLDAAAKEAAVAD